MQRWRRISGQKRHSQIHREGSSVANRLLVIRHLANGLDHSRFAFVVSKRVGNAVIRNRIKRRLREVVRFHSLSGGWDVVFIARRGIERATFREVERAAWNLLRRSRIAEEIPQQSKDERRQVGTQSNSLFSPDRGGEASEQ